MPTMRETLGFPVFFLLFGYSLFFWIAQASSWNTFTGYSGYFSFGQGAFFGVGVYSVAVLAVKHDWPLLLTFVVGGLLAAVVGLIIGVVVFRLRELRGEIFALMTLAVAFVMASIARVSPAIDGGQGVPVNNVQLPEFLGDFPTMIFRLGLIVATLAIISAQFVQRSRLGWGLFSIRDDEDVAETLGVPTFRFKITALLLTSFLAGLSGAVHSLQIGYVTIEDVFSIRVPLFVILMSILGGTKHWMGPVVGAIVVVTLNDRLNRAGFQEISDLITGGLLILMILAVKEGLYLRMRARPLRTAIGFIAGLILGYSLGALDESLITLLAYGLGIAVLAVMLPLSWFARSRAAETESKAASHG
jgi:branched-chain amino acid transport system permease protein